jgi:hypothetical protein
VGLATLRYDQHKHILHGEVYLSSMPANATLFAYQVSGACDSMGGAVRGFAPMRSDGHGDVATTYTKWTRTFSYHYLDRAILVNTPLADGHGVKNVACGDQIVTTSDHGMIETSFLMSPATSDWPVAR